MNNFNIEDFPHQRLNPLTGDWVLVSPHRAKRPWQGQVEKTVQDERPSYDPGCYLCARNERGRGGKQTRIIKVHLFLPMISALY